MGSLSAWTARARGGTTSSSSGCGVASSTRRCISELTTPRPRRAHRSGVTSTSTIADDRIRVLTAPPPITPTSPRCPSAWQPNPGGRSTYRRGNSVQTTGATSDVIPDNVMNDLCTTGAAEGKYSVSGTDPSGNKIDVTAYILCIGTETITAT